MQTMLEFKIYVHTERKLVLVLQPMRKSIYNSETHI